MNYKVERVNSTEELEGVIQLRYEILRKPWNQPAASATDEFEKISTNVFIRNLENKVIACGRIHPIENNFGQIRYMAVANEFQGKGLGKLILVELEKVAAEKGYSKIILQARENALSFYLKNGYTLKEKTFRLWNIIQHYLMEKNI